MANTLLNLLQSQLEDDQFLSQVSSQIGGADKDQTKAAASGIFSTLMTAMAKNASTPEGAASLANALERDHDGSILDNLGLLTGERQPENPKMVNGSGILNHLLGGKQGGAIQMISQLSGLDDNKTGNLMQMLAPMIMGALGKTKRQNGLDAGGIFDLLKGSVQHQKEETSQPISMISMFLDQDGDGDVTDDLLNMGGKLLGSFFKRR